jgi:hypothetical protein
MSDEIKDPKSLEAAVIVRKAKRQAELLDRIRDNARMVKTLLIAAFALFAALSKDKVDTVAALALVALVYDAAMERRIEALIEYLESEGLLRKQ